MMIGGILITTRQDFERKLRQKPTPNDISFSEIKRYLIQNGFSIANVDGSHYQFAYRQNELIRQITVVRPHPTHNGVKPFCIKEINKLIDDIREAVEAVE